ncbi:MAG: hypothetical protein AB8B50_15155 [Pirellulaceae bacterium]
MQNVLNIYIELNKNGSDSIPSRSDVRRQHRTSVRGGNPKNTHMPRSGDRCYHDSKHVRVLDKAVIRGRKDGDEHWDNRLLPDTGEQDLSDHPPIIAKFRLK